MLQSQDFQVFQLRVHAGKGGKALQSSIEPCRRSRHLSQSPFEFLTTDGFLAPTLLNQLPEFGAAAEEDLPFVYVTVKSAN